MLYIFCDPVCGSAAVLSNHIQVHGDNISEKTANSFITHAIGLAKIFLA